MSAIGRWIDSEDSWGVVIDDDGSIDYYESREDAIDAASGRRVVHIIASYYEVTP